MLQSGLGLLVYPLNITTQRSYRLYGIYVEKTGNPNNNMQNNNMHANETLEELNSPRPLDGKLTTSEASSNKQMVSDTYHQANS